MKREEVFISLKSVFEEFFFDEFIFSEELSADNIEEWDSLAHVSLIVEVEKSFDIRFESGEVIGTKNVGDLISLISKYKS